jgi:hypothetical protein
MGAMADQEYQEKSVRLVLGVEPIDAMTGHLALEPVRIDIERGGNWERPDPRDPYSPTADWGPYRHHVKHSDVRSRFTRSPAGRYSIIYHALSSAGPAADPYHPDPPAPLVVRIYDHLRRYVPRRLEIPILTRAEAEEPKRPTAHRTRRPTIFPGAAYDPCGGATGIRGRILREGKPMRWACVEALRMATWDVIARARSDDRGEFLLLLDSSASPYDEIVEPPTALIIVAGPLTAPAPPADEQLKKDPWWDLPLEPLPAPGGSDTSMAEGTALPPGYDYSFSSIKLVPFRLGRILTGNDVGEFHFQ